MQNLAVQCTIAVTLVVASSLRSETAEQNVADLDAIPQLKTIEELRIGSNSDPNIGFTRFGCSTDATRGFPNTGCIAIDNQGQLYVFETQERKIRVYSTVGRLVRTIGRAGSGPGEFESTLSASTQIGVKGDTVWVVEDISIQSRISLFRRSDGSFISASTFPRPKVRGRGVDSIILSPAVMRSDGNFITANYVRSQSRGAGPTGLSATDMLPVPRLLINAQGKVIDTLIWLRESPLRPAPPAAPVTIGGGRFSAPRPTSDSDIPVLFADGSFIVSRAAPATAAAAILRITRAGLRGEPIYARNYRYLPKRLTPALLDSLAFASLRSPSRAGAGGGAANAAAIAVQQPAPDTSARARAAMREAMSFPPYMSPVQGVFVGADASLWLRRDVTAGPNQRWDIIDPQGNPRGRVALPLAARPLWSSGNIVWVVQLDEDDVPWLVRYRVG